jgi:AraC-like DNA-binding protein
MSRTAKFIFQKDVQEIFNYFTRFLGIRIVFFSYDGQELAAGDERPKCMYCRLLREKLGFESVCRKLDREKQLLAEKEGTLVTYQCHGGMVEAVLPIYNVNKLIGYVMIGQFRNKNKMPTNIKKNWQNKFKNDELEKAFFDTPYYSKTQTDDITGLFSVMVKFITSQHLINMQRYNTINKIINYLQEHPEETLTVANAAELIHISPSSFTHLFKEATGQSFRQYQIHNKIQAAKKMIENDRNMQISDIAYKLGYEDPLYFSKVFKKIVGVSPSKFASDLVMA